MRALRIRVPSHEPDEGPVAGDNKNVYNLSMGDTANLAMYEKLGKRSDEDVIVPAIKCMQNINLLVEDMTCCPGRR